MLFSIHASKRIHSLESDHGILPNLPFILPLLEENGPIFLVHLVELASVEKQLDLLQGTLDMLILKAVSFHYGNQTTDGRFAFAGKQ